MTTSWHLAHPFKLQMRRSKSNEIKSSSLVFLQRKWSERLSRDYLGCVQTKCHTYSAASIGLPFLTELTGTVCPKWQTGSGQRTIHHDEISH